MNAVILVTQGVREKKWLTYVTQVFHEVTGISMELSESGKATADGMARIVYSPDPPEDKDCIHIPELPLCDTHLEIPVRFSGDLFRGTVIEDSEIPIHHPDKPSLSSGATSRTPAGVAFSFDLFRNAFLRLSCATERRLEQRHGPRHSYGPKSLKAESYLKPVVNYLFEALKAALKAVHPGLPETGSTASPLLLTHDIDAVGKTFLKAAKQSVMNLSKLPRAFCLHGASRGFALLKSALTLPFGSDDFDRIEVWREWDRAANADTAYYVYARVPNRTLAERAKTAVFDPDYDISKDEVLSQRIKNLRRSGSVIGLHGSFSSYDNAERLSSEKKALEQAVDAPVDQIRQHWLRFRFDGTWRAQEEAGFKVDSGFGFNDVLGFRAWICHPFRPWDEKKQAAHALTVIPMAAMDSTLFDYLDLPPQNILETLSGLMQETKKFGGRVAFNWHTHGASRHLGWDELYRRAIAIGAIG